MNELLKKLISVKSVSGSESEIQEFIHAWGINNGIDSQRQDDNVVYFIEGKSSKKCIILNGHVDTVPAGDDSKWKYPATGDSIEEESEKIYGLGSSDMKSGIAMFMQMALEYQTTQPEVDVWISFVVGEEIDGKGSKSFAKWFANNHLEKYEKAYCLIAEPTNLDQIQMGHKGNYFLRITTHGDSGHGSRPHLIKKHAVEEMFKVKSKIQELEEYWQQEYSDDTLGMPTIAYFTSINAGDDSTPNKFPDTCSATFDIRTTKQLHDEVLSQITEKLKEYDCKIEEATTSGSVGYTNPTDTFVKLVEKTCDNLPLVAASGASDMSFFTELGIPTLLLGPGELSCIHMPNEFVFKNKIESCMKIYKGIIEGINQL